VLRDYCHPVVEAARVMDSPVAARLLDEPLVLWRTPDGIACFRDLCIHRGTPLSLGWIDGTTLVCAYHGWGYAPDGDCIRIPALPADRSVPRKARVDTFAAVERYGLIWVCLGTPRAPIPVFPEGDDPSYWYYIHDPATLTWHSSAARATENFADLAHLAWVHEGILGDRRYPETPTFPITRRGEALEFVWDQIPDSAHPTVSKHPYANRRTYTLTRPFSIELRIEQLVTGRVEAFFQTQCPVAARETVGFQIVARNYEVDAAERQRLIDMENLINGQDRVIVERQRPEDLPLDLAAELHIKGPDAVAVEYRRFMAELGVNVDAR
jgi:phenylpropionate dioxygenase-like ring-hydroxylating dioxygenase large terminal subunit